MSRQTRLVVAAATAAAFVLLSALVALGLTQALDTRLRDAFRPGDGWGPMQVRVDLVVEGLRPAWALAGFGALVLVLALKRRSSGPLRYGALLLAVSGLPALAVKVGMARTDPHYELSSAGSFPSGHTLVLLVCLGGALTLLRHRPAWWEWLPVAAVDAAMALSLLNQAAHWFTDVLAGVLLGVAALALVPFADPPPAGQPSIADLTPTRRRSAAGPPSR